MLTPTPMIYFSAIVNLIAVAPSGAILCFFIFRSTKPSHVIRDVLIGGAAYIAAVLVCVEMYGPFPTDGPFYTDAPTIGFTSAAVGPVIFETFARFFGHLRRFCCLRPQSVH